MKSFLKEIVWAKAFLWITKHFCGLRTQHELSKFSQALP